jgi:hypothetical protein
MKTLPRFVAAPYQNAKQQSSGLLPSKIPDYGAKLQSKQLYIAPYNDCKTNPEGKAVCIIGKDEPCCECRTCLRFWY